MRCEAPRRGGATKQIAKRVSPESLENTYPRFAHLNKGITMTTIAASEIIETKILFIRGRKVMLDRDLAILYGVETNYLTRQVRRNIERFPPTFFSILHIKSLQT